MKKQTITTPQEMFAAGKAAGQLSQRCLIHGKLGVGKTTFAKGFAAAHGINPDQVTSPTYTYFQHYNDQLLHVDMWRVESPEHAHELGVFDALNQYDQIIVERPKFLHDYTDEGRLQVLIDKQSDGSRTLELR